MWADWGTHFLSLLPGSTETKTPSSSFANEARASSLKPRSRHAWLSCSSLASRPAIKSATAMVREADKRATEPQGSGSDIDWNAIHPDDPIEPSRFATWVFMVEDKGARIKR